MFGKRENRGQTRLKAERKNSQFSQQNRLSKAERLLDIWNIADQHYQGKVAFVLPESRKRVDYSELTFLIASYAAGLQAMGVVKGDYIAVLSERSHRVLAMDQGIQTVGAVSIVVHTFLQETEIRNIMANARPRFLVLSKNAKESCVGENSIGSLQQLPLYSFEEIVERGRTHTLVSVDICGTDAATVMFTEGAEGPAKGVILSHANLLHQIIGLGECFASIEPGETVLALLPPWHPLQRLKEYFFLSR